MAWAKVTDGTSASNAAVAVTQHQSTLVVAAVGNLLIASGGCGGASEPSCSDTALNSWTRVSGTAANGARLFVFWAIANGTGSTTITVTWASSTYCALYSVEYSGTNASPYDTNSFTSGLANNADPMLGANYTTAVADEIVFVVGEISLSPPALTTYSIYTVTKTNSDNAKVMAVGEPGVAGTYTPGLDAITSLSDWAMLAVAFKPFSGSTPKIKERNVRRSRLDDGLFAETQLKNWF